MKVCENCTESMTNAGWDFTGHVPEEWAIVADELNNAAIARAEED